MRMTCNLMNGKQVVADFDETVGGYQAGHEFRKAVLLEAAKQMTTPVWTSIKAVRNEA